MYTQATVTPVFPKKYVTDDDMDVLGSAGAQVYHDEEEDTYYFYTDESYFEEEFEETLQAILRRMPEEEFPYIMIEAACTCDKPRIGEFGGFAVFITREDIQVMNTGLWINQMRRKYEQKEEYYGLEVYAWKEIDEGLPVTPRSDPKVYEHPFDLLFSDRDEAIKALRELVEMEECKDWVLCKRTLEPIGKASELAPEDICPKCGQWFANHNDDGSCVED
jgi:predicted nucleotidyltransferase